MHIFPQDLSELPLIQQPAGIYVGKTAYVEQRVDHAVPLTTQGKFLLPDNRWVFITRGLLIFQRYPEHPLLMYGRLNDNGVFANEYKGKNTP